MKAHVSKLLAYVANKNKTTMELEVKIDNEAENLAAEILGLPPEHFLHEEKKFVTGINCTPENANEVMLALLEGVDSSDIQAYHGYQSFKPGEVDADTMRTQASVKIDRKIGGTNAEMPNTQMSTSEQFEPYVPKIRKSGTGCLYQVNENLWEGSFYPKMPDGKRKKFNVYAKTKEECEQALAEMIAEKKAEIANERAKMEQGEG